MRRVVIFALFVAGVVVGSGAGMVPAQATTASVIGSSSTHVTAGPTHTCALISDGTVHCWGYNGDGNLGTRDPKFFRNGDKSTSNVPLVVTGGALANKRATQIAAGGLYTCALISNGTVTCWGYLLNPGYLGNGTATGSEVPVAVTGGALANKTVTQIAAGPFHTCALISDGTVTCWGSGRAGELGNGDDTDSNVPVAVTGGALANKTVTQIAAGGYYTCALVSDGTVTCWGNGSFGNMGNGTNTGSEVPVAVTGGALANKTVTQIAAGEHHTCAVLSDGTVTCWGYNWAGQLGNGTNTSSNVPVAVTGGALANKKATQIAAGASHTCALISDGTVTCWGESEGNGTNTSSNVPVAVTGGALANKKATQIAAGASHTCAAISDGSVTCWGNGRSGQLGNGTNTDSNVPVAVVMLARNIMTPTISGTARVGKTLTAKKGTWTGSPAPTFTYQWYACTQKVASATQTVPSTCKPINGQTKTTFKLTASHKGKYVGLAVAGTSSGTPKTLWLAKTTTKVS